MPKPSATTTTKPAWKPAAAKPSAAATAKHLRKEEVAHVDTAREAAATAALHLLQISAAVVARALARVAEDGICFANLLEFGLGFLLGIVALDSVWERVRVCLEMQGRRHPKEPQYTPGCHLRAAFLYALLISDSPAVFSTPRIL